MIRVESRDPNPFVIAWTLACFMPAYDIMRLVLAWAHARCSRYPSVKRMFCTHCLRTDGAYMMGKPFEVRDANGYLLDGSCYTIGKSGAVVYAPPAPIKFRIEPKEPVIPIYRPARDVRLWRRSDIVDTDPIHLPANKFGSYSVNEPDDPHPRVITGKRATGKSYGYRIPRASQPNPQPSTRMVYRNGEWRKS